MPDEGKRSNGGEGAGNQNALSALASEQEGTKPEAVGPCGSQRVTERLEGHEYRIVWCGRTAGPCPFPGTQESGSSERKCADSPGRRLAVVYADGVVEAARDGLREYLRASQTSQVRPPSVDHLYVALAALVACVGEGQT